MSSLRQIRLAVALGEHGNFARAAKALNLSQPSLSRGIASLERSYRVRLFDRTRKGVKPTTFGRVLLERGADLLRSDAALRREIQLLAGLDLGTLLISAGPMASEVSVTAAVARVAQRHPKLRIRLQTRDPAVVIQDVLDERVDIGVAQVSDPAQEERLVVEPRPLQRIYIACRPGHPLTKEKNPSFARALDFPLASNILRGPVAVAVRGRGTGVDSGKASSPDFVPQFVVDSQAAARRIARESDALCAGTASSLADDVKLRNLVRLKIDAPILRTVHSVLYLRDRTLSPAAEVFLATLREVEAATMRADATGSRQNPVPWTTQHP